MATRIEDDPESPPRSGAVDRSLENLMDFVRSMPAADDRKVISIWASYNEMQSQALAGRESLDDEVSAEKWKEIYDSAKQPTTLLI